MDELSWKDRVAWGRDRLLHGGMRLMPTPMVSSLGAALGDLSARRRSNRLGRAVEALAHIRPDLDEDARLALARENMRHMGRTMAEFAAVDRFEREGRISAVGWEHVPGPAVAIMLHLGNWEVGTVAVRMAGRELRAIYQAPRNRGRLAVARQVRRRLGVDALQGDNPMAMRRGLRMVAEEGGIFAFFVDEFMNGRVNAPAFGRPPAPGGNIAMAARLARMAKAPLVVVYCLRLPGPRFVLHILPALALTGDEAADQALIEATIEPVVRAHLEQWFMLYAFRRDR